MEPKLPVCPKCNLPMEIHKTMTGDRYICDNYAYCGESKPFVSKKAPKLNLSDSGNVSYG